MRVRKLARPIGFAAVVVVAVSILVAGAKEPTALRSGARAAQPKRPVAPGAAPLRVQPARGPVARSSTAMAVARPPEAAAIPVGAADLGTRSAGPSAALRASLAIRAEMAKAGAPKAAETGPAPARPPAPPAPRGNSPRQALAYGSLPPLMLASSGPEAGAQGPPPGVLWLAGVIHGSPKLAVIRRGQERFLVREGESVGGIYRVSRITADTVTLQRGRRTLVLRLGQFS